MTGSVVHAQGLESLAARLEAAAVQRAGAAGQAQQARRSSVAAARRTSSLAAAEPQSRKPSGIEPPAASMDAASRRQSAGGGMQPGSTAAAGAPHRQSTLAIAATENLPRRASQVLCDSDRPHALAFLSQVSMLHSANTHDQTPACTGRSGWVLRRTSSTAHRRSSVAVSPALGAILGKISSGDPAELAPASFGSGTGGESSFFPDLPQLTKARADLSILRASNQQEWLLCLCVLLMHAIRHQLGLMHARVAGCGGPPDKAGEGERAAAGGPGSRQGRSCA